MLCKFCKFNTIVVDGVDNRDSDETYRLRVCPKCGRMFYTVEFPVEVNKAFIKDWYDHHKNYKPVMKNTYISPEGIKKFNKKYHGKNKKTPKYKGKKKN